MTDRIAETLMALCLLLACAVGVVAELEQCNGCQGASGARMVLDGGRE
jgi:hypothetical protein